MARHRARIAALDSHLGELHRDVGTLRTRISASIARERDTYAIGTATHSPSTLGQWLTANAADLGYIPDEIEPSVPCPLAGTEIADLTGWPGYSIPPTALRRACTCPPRNTWPHLPRNTWPHLRNWPLQSPSCATYVTAWPLPRAWSRIVSRWSALALTILPS
jgi:hypothetical protein